MIKYVILILIIINSNYLFGQKDSLYREYNNQGKLILEGKIIVNEKKFTEVRVGLWKRWDDTLGYLKFTYNYKNDRYHGDYFEYYQNGKIKVKGYYDYNYSFKETKTKNGNLVYYEVAYGIWEGYDLTGKLIWRSKFNKRGKQIKEEHF